jgi:RHS repeat-associated protein
LSRHSFEYGDSIARPHALTKINTPDTSYSPPPQKITYTCFNKVSAISDILSGGTPLTLDFTCGLRNQRMKTIQARNGTTERIKWYDVDYEEDSTSSGLKKYHYIYGGTGLVAIFVKEGSGNDTMYYVLSDHLGSLTTLVNASTNAVQKYSFNAWGLPRDPEDWSQGFTGELFAGRGFTSHEHLSEFNLINMNGRVYDPILGRFLSPDPIIQFPNFPNNFNRYTYALNNPLRFTDPSGYYVQENTRDNEYNERVAGYSIAQGTIGRPMFSSYGPSFSDYNTWVEGPNGGMWVSNSNYHTIYSTDPAFVDFFDNLAAE